ncbi:MAG: SDR family oxidoreductase [Cyanobacteria bacterium J06633_8]
MDIQSTETELQQQNNSNLEKIAIIGCGYVGTAASCYWYQQGHSVTVTTTRQERIAELEDIATKVVVMKGGDSQAVKSLLQAKDTVVLSIAPISNKQVDAEVYRETYIPTAKNLVAALQENNSVKQLIYLSSVSVYGNKNGEWVDENSPIDRESEYNQVLSEAEQLLLNSASEDVKITILRLGGIYGEGRELMKRFAKLAGKNIDGSGETFTSWIHLDDVIAAMDYISQRRLGGIFNLVNDFDFNIRELSDKICELGNLEKILWDDTKPSYRSLNARINNQKIKAAGYKLIHPKTIV